ncbi:FH1/FH2 domain-containing protein 1 isoform X2 [Syngnathus typhle]|uniref:FH1/FH2 domain-containing protein 1 isoform X2 n=1 Tax=Syngnathus typhle TaxID=161592 RepID=UPI002A6AF96C|nr:FH1/FH2 domain-containing protein 1 isoform X2 [Syngnathus typhle]
MKESEQSGDKREEDISPSRDSERAWPQAWPQAWPLQAAARLRLDVLDFTDLWDEENLQVDAASRSGRAWSEEGSCGVLAPPPPPFLLEVSPVKSATLKLHWRPLQSVPPLPSRTRFGTRSIWSLLEPVRLDTAQLVFLFERKGKSSAPLAAGRGKRVSVLGLARSNNISITLSGLPPQHLLPPAIFSMDGSVLDREDIRRLQTLIPSEEELCLIKEAKGRHADLCLAPADLCLLALGEIPHLGSRLQLWAFVLDYDSLEQEIAKPLFYLKQAMEQLLASQAFRHVLATVLAVGNVLNGCEARGFELSYLGKLSQVRDTHSRQPLLHHVCALVLQLYPHSSDLCSDLSAVSKAGKCDYLLVRANLERLEALSEGSWEQMTTLLDHRSELRRRLPNLLKERADRTEVLRAVHRRVTNRFHSFLLFLGYSRAMARETRAQDFCRTISNFSLEFRAAQQTLLRQKERAARSQRAKSPLSRTEQSEQHSMLEEVLRRPESASGPDGTVPLRRRRISSLRGPVWTSCKR